MIRYLVASAAVLFLLVPQLHAELDTPQRRSPVLERKVANLDKEVANLKREIAYLKLPPVPDQLFLCNKAIPLSNEDVREDFEREFYQLAEDRGLLTILVKRYDKFFSVVSEELNRTDMPQDLIYLAMAESYLNPRALSRASAGGMWQFIKDTAKREGLSINDTIDERYSVIGSTRTALAYLKKLHDEFGDWFIAMAAYNAGEVRLREALANQNTRDFFELYLPEETERYIFRIAAVKEIVGNPKKYGLPIEKDDYYRPYEVAEVTVELDRETHTALLAQAMDLPYKAFREYNLHIRKYKIPRGIYHLYVPIEKKDTFLKGIRNCPGATLQ